MKTVAGSDIAGRTVRSLLTGRFGMSTRALKRLKYRENGITVNGKHVTVRYILCEGDVLELDLSDIRDEGEQRLIPRDLPVDVVYSDGTLTVCDKPPYMPTHPVHGHLDDTLANALAFRSGDPDYVFRPLTRLDRNTSGLAVSSENFVAAGKLSKQMRAGQIKKTYLAIVCGCPEKSEGVIDAPIARAGSGTLMRVVDESGERAVTAYRVISVSPDRSHSLVRLMPETGRTHQIRVHMAYIGCPLAGDFLYGTECPEIGRHALHASKIELFHPTDGRRMVFCSAMPADMTKLLKDYRIL